VSLACFTGRGFFYFYKHTRKKIMKSETLRLQGTTLDETTATNVARVLNHVKGVSNVAIATASGSVNIDFDEDVTSTQELRTLLQREGFSVKEPVHGEDGICCGSCGS
jgi:CCGSCS motif protein